ncbi:FATTY ACID EXPORT 3, chloroplastic-like protein [Drosera capensis]
MTLQAGIPTTILQLALVKRSRITVYIVLKSLKEQLYSIMQSSAEQFCRAVPAAMAMASMYLANPNPSLGLPLNNRASPIAFRSSSTTTSPRSPFRPHLLRSSVPPSPAAASSVRVTLGPLPLSRAAHHRSLFQFVASADHSKSSEPELEEDKNNLQESDKASQEAWKQVLASFKKQALKLLGVSQEAYEMYSKKAMTVLKETAEKLKIHADQARYDLAVVTRELGQEGKEYLAIAAEHSPEPVKDVVEIFALPSDDINDISQLQDFYVGIPYGVILALGGFLNFMVTGSTSAIRFGVILGGSLLALSVFSLRSWKRGEPSQVALKWQAAIAGILFLRNARLFCQVSYLALVIMLCGWVLPAYFEILPLSSDLHPSCAGESNYSAGSNTDQWGSCGFLCIQAHRWQAAARVKRNPAKR